MIAEAFPIADQLATRDYLEARLGQFESSMLREIHSQISSLQRWMLAFMASLWLGLGGMIAAIVVKG